MTRSVVSVGLSEVRHLEELKDPLSTVHRFHSRPNVLMICLMAVLAGAVGPTAIYRWVVLKQNLLVDALDLPHGVPSGNVVRRVLCVLKVNAFQACFVNWLNGQRSLK